VSAALAEYVKRRKQLHILDAFGTVDFDPKYDYKTKRRRNLRTALQEFVQDGRANCFREYGRKTGFRKGRDALRAFDEPQLRIQDYEEAARINNI
jgi:hypothetical protein